MSGDETFLARWARRKRSASGPPAERAKPEADTQGVTSNSPPAASTPDAVHPPAVPADLPPIDSIGPGSDIRPFLAAGVPPDLARAALRRAWIADPAIHDFVGLSENAWDFTAPGGVPGFGSMTADEVRQLIGRVFEAERPPPEPATDTVSTGQAPAAETESRSDTPPTSPMDEQAAQAKAASAQNHAALQRGAVDETQCRPLGRTHGGALPR